MTCQVLRVGRCLTCKINLKHVLLNNEGEETLDWSYFWQVNYPAPLAEDVAECWNYWNRMEVADLQYEFIQLRTLKYLCLAVTMYQITFLVLKKPLLASLWAAFCYSAENPICELQSSRQNHGWQEPIGVLQIRERPFSFGFCSPTNRNTSGIGMATQLLTKRTSFDDNQTQTWEHCYLGYKKNRVRNGVSRYMRSTMPFQAQITTQYQQQRLWHRQVR